MGGIGMQAMCHRPNQDYYVNKLKGMSYSSFISPDNEEVVLNEISNALRS